MKPIHHVLVWAALYAAGCAEKTEAVLPAEVSEPTPPLDTQSPGEPPPEDANVSDKPRDTRPGAETSGHGLWVVDDEGVAVGALIRRGSDDATVGRAIYDFVTVYHPDSGLFFEVTMSDGVIRYPANTFFSGYGCDTPVGIGAGGCAECRSGYGLGFLHKGAWWQVRGGSAFETMGPGSVMKGGLSGECVAHGTSNAKLFPVDRVSGTAPPTSFSPPLSFEWR
jgi:hypothetical protein